MVYCIYVAFHLISYSLYKGKVRRAPSQPFTRYHCGISRVENIRECRKMPKYNCSICNRFAAASFLPVLRHIGQVHQYEANFQVKCGLDSCPCLYRTYNSFKSHVYRKHRSAMTEEDVVMSENMPPSAFDL